MLYCRAQQIISRQMYIRMGLTHHVILGKSLLPSGSVLSFVGATVGGFPNFPKVHYLELTPPTPARSWSLACGGPKVDCGHPPSL